MKCWGKKGFVLRENAWGKAIFAWSVVVVVFILVVALLVKTIPSGTYYYNFQPDTKSRIHQGWKRATGRQVGSLLLLSKWKNHGHEMDYESRYCLRILRKEKNWSDEVAAPAWQVVAIVFVHNSVGWEKWEVVGARVKSECWVREVIVEKWKVPASTGSVRQGVGRRSEEVHKRRKKCVSGYLCTSSRARSVRHGLAKRRSDAEVRCQNTVHPRDIRLGPAVGDNLPVFLLPVSIFFHLVIHQMRH